MAQVPENPLINQCQGSGKCSDAHTAALVRPVPFLSCRWHCVHPWWMMLWQSCFLIAMTWRAELGSPESLQLSCLGKETAAAQSFRGGCLKEEKQKMPFITAVSISLPDVSIWEEGCKSKWIHRPWKQGTHESPRPCRSPSAGWGGQARRSQVSQFGCEQHI